MKNPIRLTIITENEPFYLAEALDHLLSQLPDCYQVNFAVVLNYYHTSDKVTKNRFNAFDVFTVFGPLIFFRILWRVILGRLKKSKQVNRVFKDYNIPIKSEITNINSTATVEAIKNQSPDILVSIGVNSLFQKPLREAAKIGCINVHTGIKPEHRGRASVFWALADGHEETGITVHYIDEQIDAGKVITTSPYKIKERSFDKVSRDLRFLGMDTLLEALSILNKGALPLKEITEVQQKCYKVLPNREDLKYFARQGNKVF